MAMIRYSKGITKKLKGRMAQCRFIAKSRYGKLTRYPVYRPDIDHSLYEVDNRLLGSTTRDKALIIHQMSWQKPISKPALVEFEHGLALINPPDRFSDFVQYRESIPKRIEAFFSWFIPGVHRLCGSSSGAMESFLALARQHGKDVPLWACETLKWSHIKSRSIIRPPRNRLRVFHYGGWYPFAKGTHDILALAKLFPSVDFEISVDLEQPCVKSVRCDNVHLYPAHSRRLYNAAMKRSHILLHPIYSDGWGVGLEALSLAMPMIVYDSYDKSEIVINEKTGYLISVPKQLSYLDSFYTGPYQNWDEYNTYVADHDNSQQVELLAEALEKYCRQPEMLLEHSREASIFFDLHHNPAARVRRIREIYAEILSAMEANNDYL